MVTISTTLSQESIDQIKKARWHYNELIVLGMEAKRNMPHLLERINALERGNEKLQRHVTEVCTELSDMRMREVNR